MAREKAGKAASKKRAAKPEPAAHAVPPEKAVGERASAFNPGCPGIDGHRAAAARPAEGGRAPTKTYDIIIDVNRDYPGGRDKAQQRIKELIAALVRTHGVDPQEQGVHVRKTDMTQAIRVRQAARRPDPGAGQEGSREGQARARPGAGAARALSGLARLRGPDA